MRPLHLKLVDFGSYARADADLSGLTLAAIVGKNGVGKSTILEAMRVALFGRKAGTLDDLIRTGAPSFSVVFDFEAGGKTYRVMREQGKQGQKAALFVESPSGMGWQPASDVKVSDIDAKIVEILGCGYAEFTMAHHIPQGELGAFAAMDPADRKAWLMENLPMQVWSDLEAKAKAHASALTNDSARIEGALMALDPRPFDFEAHDAKIAEVQTVLTERKATYDEAMHAYTEGSEANAEHARLTAEWEAARRTLLDAQGRSNRNNEDFDQCRARKRESEERLARPLPPLVDVSEVHAEQEQLQEQAHRIGTLIEGERHAGDRAQEALSSREAAAKRLEQAYRALQDFQAESAPVCQTCGQAVAGEARANVMRVLEQACDAAREGMAGADSDWKMLAKIWDDAKGATLTSTHDLEAIKERSAHLKGVLVEAGNIAAVHQSAEREKINLEHLEADLLMLTERVSVSTREVLAAQAKMNEWDDALEGLEAIDLFALQRTLQQHQDALAEAEKEVQILDLERTHAEAQESKREALKGDKAQVLKQLALMNLLVKAYGKKGIPARIIENAVVEIEDYANAFLARFADGLTLSFETQAENKTGGMKETLDILVTNATGTRKLERYSGGERTRIYFALSVALADFVARTGGATISSFAVDEPEYLDADGLNELVECLHVLSKSVPAVYLISHYEGVSDTIPQRIRVTRGPSGSNMEVLV